MRNDNTFFVFCIKKVGADTIKYPHPHSSCYLVIFTIVIYGASVPLCVITCT